MIYKRLKSLNLTQIDANIQLIIYILSFILGLREENDAICNSQFPYRRGQLCLKRDLRLKKCDES